MKIQFKNYLDLSQEEILHMAELDCNIPMAYDPFFQVNEKMLKDRVKYYEDLVINGFFKIAFAEQKIIGFHALSLKDHEATVFAHIGTFWIHPDYQRQGIGKEMKLMGEAWARANKCAYIQTGEHASNSRMLEINLQAGYEVFSQIMRKSLL